MKLTAFLLIVAVIQVSAKGTAQTVTYRATNEPITRVFEAIRNQTGYTFVFRNQDVKHLAPVSVAFDNTALADALQTLLKNARLRFTIEDNAVFISKSNTSPTISDELHIALPPITGTVRGPDGQPLAGINVILKGTKQGTSTDADGRFTLNADNGQVLVVSGIGYASREITIDNASINISLAIADNKLDEVQIIAYGTTTNRLNTGNTGIVTAKEIENQPVGNPLLALQGRVPGLFITQATGIAGSGVNVMIQGQNSIAMGTNPFYVIDGVPYLSQLPPNILALPGISEGAGLNGAAGGGNPLSFLNPSDIESVTVLKDADATAIYGSRAANGAILITTKKGKAGKTKVTLNLQEGWGRVSHKMKLLSTPQYLELRHEALRNDGILAPRPSDYDLNGLWDTTRYTDWQKELIGGTAHYTNLTANVTGGNNLTKYLIGTTYHRETSVFPGNFANKKGSVILSLNSFSADQKFTLQFSGNYLVDDNRLPGTDLTSRAVSTLSPVAPKLLNDDGSLNWQPTSSGASTLFNPLSFLEERYTGKASNLISNLQLSYALLPGLNLKSSFGYTSFQLDETATHPLSALRPEIRPGSERAADYSTSQAKSWIIEPQVTYDLEHGPHHIGLLIGSSISQNNSSSTALNGMGYNTDDVLEDIRSATSVTVSSASEAVSKYNALFGRINYRYLGKFLVNLTARRDGSSRFGSANRFHNFGAVGAGWVLSQEDFFQRALPVISFAKLKASYGTTGNDQIGNYTYLNSYGPVSGSIPFQNASGLSPSLPANPYLQWEETRKFNIGLDLGLWRDRLYLTVNYFRNRSSNLLQQRTLPAMVGPGSIVINFPAVVQNTGLELTATSDNIKNKYFTWSTSINLTVPRNKLVRYPDIETSFDASRLVVGRSINITKVYHSLGVNPATGEYQLADAEGKPAVELSQAAYSVITDLAPKFYGGISNNFSYRGFRLDILFQFTKRKGPDYLLGTTPGQHNRNQPIYVYNNRWRAPGDVAKVQRVNADGSLIDLFNNTVYSDYAYADASFVRLKNVSLGWQLPAGLTNKLRIENCSLFVNAQNLLTFTHYQGLDPETLSFTSLPTLRMVTAGIQVTF